MTDNGKIFLIGAGPGDHRLITDRGKEIMKEADIVFYDRLVNPSLLAFIPSETKKVYVGKSRNNHSYTQSEINKMSVKEAINGKKVVRLKGGDPFVFGRGGEEALYFAENKVDFEIIPGISSVIGAAAYAGIPVTHREVSSSFHIYTGHSVKRLNFENMADLNGTMIIVMGLKNLGKISKNLVKAGLSPEKPVAVIRYGTTGDQKTITGTLSSIQEKVKSQGITPPVLTIIGEVVNLRKDINWYENMPLFGKRIMITRPYGQNRKMGQMLEKLGVEVLYYPTIEIKGPIYTEKLKKTTNNIEKYNWILFTSKNGIKYWFQFLKKEDIDIRRLFPVKFGVIGPGTGQELKKYGIKADFMPSQYTTSVMVEEFISQMEEKGTDILLPRADIASKGIINRLKETQNTVTDISIYKTVIPDVSGERLISHLEERDLNLITFTSSSTVNYLMKIFKTDKDKILKIPAACIGPVTAETAREQGFRVVAEAGEHTIKGLVNKIKEYYLI